MTDKLKWNLLKRSQTGPEAQAVTWDLTSTANVRLQTLKHAVGIPIQMVLEEEAIQKQTKEMVASRFLRDLIQVATQVCLII